MKERETFIPGRNRGKTEEKGKERIESRADSKCVIGE